MAKSYGAVYHDIIKKKLPHYLYQHSLGVAQSGQELAYLYGEDPVKAYQSGLLHDYAKSYSTQVLRNYAAQQEISLDEISWKEPQLLHGPVGALLLREELKVEDPEILEAVYYHTTGAPGLGKLGKIIFLADVIEEGRSYPGVEKLRRAAREDLRAALIQALDQTIKLVIDRCNLLHPYSVAFRNELLDNSISGVPYESNPF